MSGAVQIVGGATCKLGSELAFMGRQAPHISAHEGWNVFLELFCLTPYKAFLALKHPSHSAVSCTCRGEQVTQFHSCPPTPSLCLGRGRTSPG